MRRFYCYSALLVLGTTCLLPLYAKAPAELKEVAPVDELAAEAQEGLKQLEQLLATEQAYEEAKDGKLPQTAGVVAVLAQAIAEHPGGSQVKLPASLAVVRNAAIDVWKATSYADAQSAYARIGEGKAGDASAEHEWNKLIRLGRLMEEVNLRSTKLRRSLRRSRDPKEDARNASVLAVLGLPMYADTHEVKNEAQIPDWQQHAREYQQAMTETAAGFRDNDLEKARTAFEKANMACHACHEKFQVEE